MARVIPRFLHNVLAKVGLLNTEEQAELQALQHRLRTILPEEYQDRYEELEPVSMGSAAIKYGVDGKVAWGEIWESFCDLAMAGGPPHKGILLEPGDASEIDQLPDQYRAVVNEITRGIQLASEIAVIGSKQPGWVRLDCGDKTMAEWLLKAVIMENISCRWEGSTIDLPAGPRYRVEKEIKNVITPIAKTTHYWIGHIWEAKREEIRQAFAEMAAESPLVQPALVGIECTPEQLDAAYQTTAREIHETTGLPISNSRYPGWLGVRCPNVRTAVWMMRLLSATNTLARREREELFVPINPTTDPQGHIVANSFGRVHGFARSQMVVDTTRTG